VYTHSLGSPPERNPRTSKIIKKGQAKMAKMGVDSPLSVETHMRCGREDIDCTQLADMRVQLWPVQVSIHPDLPPNANL
jgi:hypothetical protein